MFTAVPERKFFFKGATEKAVKAETFEMEPRVEYPMEGGTALVTFEEEVGEFISESPSSLNVFNE